MAENLAEESHVNVPGGREGTQPPPGQTDVPASAPVLQPGIYFQNFFPQRFRQHPQEVYESLELMMRRANEWIRQLKDRTRVINIETLLLPGQQVSNLPYYQVQVPGTISHMSPFFQIVRIWYEIFEQEALNAEPLLDVGDTGSSE